MILFNPSCISQTTCGCDFLIVLYDHQQLHFYISHPAELLFCSHALLCLQPLINKKFHLILKVIIFSARFLSLRTICVVGKYVHLSVRNVLRHNVFIESSDLESFLLQNTSTLFFKSLKQRSKEAILLGHADFGPSSRKERSLSGKSLELIFHSDRAESRKEYFEIR